MPSSKKRKAFGTNDPAPMDHRHSKALNPTWQERLQQRWHLWLTFLLIVIGSALVFSFTFTSLDVEQLEVEILNTYPHDTSAFTQGLVYHDGYLYESTGRLGESTLRKVEIETGKVLTTIPLSEDLFGEGLTMVGDQFYQITWKSGVGFVYNKDLQLVKQFDYSGQGWGLAYDGKHIILSDGAAALRFFNPGTFEEVGQVFVKYGVTRLIELNELEFVDGLLYANKWHEDVIYVIDPKTGDVKAKAIATNLLKDNERPGWEDDGSLNGIAYNPDKGTFYITGKKWPKLFEVRFRKKR